MSHLISQKSFEIFRASSLFSEGNGRNVQSRLGFFFVLFLPVCSGWPPGRENSSVTGVFPVMVVPRGAQSCHRMNDPRQDMACHSAARHIRAVLCRARLKGVSVFDNWLTRAWHHTSAEQRLVRSGMKSGWLVVDSTVVTLWSMARHTGFGEFTKGSECYLSRWNMASGEGDSFWWEISGLASVNV